MQRTNNDSVVNEGGAIKVKGYLSHALLAIVAFTLGASPLAGAMTGGLIGTDVSVESTISEDVWVGYLEATDGDIDQALAAINKYREVVDSPPVDDGGDDNGDDSGGDDQQQTGFQLGAAVAGLEFQENTLPGVVNVNFNANSAERYQTVASQGFDTVRIPFLTARLFGEWGSHAIVESYATLIDQNIEWAADNGLDVWLDAHDYGRVDGRALGAAGFGSSHYRSLKVQTVNRFKHHDNFVAFEIDNEPHDLPGGVDDWYAKAVNAVEGVLAIPDWDGKVGLPIYGWSSNDDFFNNHGNDFVAPIVNDRVSYVFHNYFNQGNTGFNHPAQPNETAQIHVDRAQAVLDWAAAQGVRTSWTEFGWPDTAEWGQNAAPFVQLLADNADDIDLSVYWATGDWYASDTTLRDSHFTVLDNYLD